MTLYSEYKDQIKAIPPVTRQSIEAAVFEGFDQFVGTKAQIEQREAELNAQVAERYKTASSNRTYQINTILEQYKAALFKQEGLKDDKINEVIYLRAWNMGHSFGYDEVENQFIELVNMVDTISGML